MKQTRSMIAVYGILKRTGSLPLSYMKGSKFVSEGTIPGAALFHIGYGVGLRLEPKIEQAQLPPITVEVWDILNENWPHLDALENNGRVYDRKVVEVTLKDQSKIDAWVYEHIAYEPEFYDEKRLIETGNYGGSRYATHGS